MEALEGRTLLSSILGEVLDDTNGNGLRDPGELGLSGVTVTLDRFNEATGAVSPVTSTTTRADGTYLFENVTAGTYLVGEQVPAGSIQTFPVAEHVARSYLITVGDQDVTLGSTLSSPLAPPVDNWLASLPAGNYSFPVAGDFLFQFGSQGNAPSRVFFTGDVSVETKAPVVTPNAGGGESGEEGTTTTTVETTVTQLTLRGTIRSDQHEQGYLGPITLTLTVPSPGQITSRRDSLALADSSLNINATVEIPRAFGVPTTLHTAVPINFLAREIARFPALGSTYDYRGTQPPISLLDAQGNTQGTLYFASLKPLAGYDFGRFTLGSISGRAYIDVNTNGVFDEGDSPLMNHPIILQPIAEVSGPTGDEGSGGTKGSGGPPEGKGEHSAVPVTIYTDTNGLYSFTNLGPGGYTVRQPDAYPLSVLVPDTEDHSYTIDTLTSGAALTFDFINEFIAGQLNHGTAPGYGPVSHLIVPNLHLGATEFANAPGQVYINDGVRFGSAMVPGGLVPMSITVVVPAGQTAYLSGWLDAQGHGGFAPGDGAEDHGDQIRLAGDPAHPYLKDYVIGEGIHTLSLTLMVPEGMALPGGQLATFARFRLSTTPALGPDSGGELAPPDGEVEDYAVTIYDPSSLGTIQGQTYEDVNGNGLLDPGEPGFDGWTVVLVNLDDGRIVASQVSAARDIDLGSGTLVTVHGLYRFDAVMPGRYEVRATPPTDQGPVIVTAPSAEEAVVYRFVVSAGETVGSPPYATTPASPGWLESLPAGTDTLFALGQFMIMIGGGGGHATGGEASGGTETSRPIKLSVVGPAVIFHDVMGIAGAIPAEITGLQLEGLAVQSSEEGGPITVLGPVLVRLGIFRSLGTLGASSGHGEETESGDGAAFSVYLEFDLTALGYGKVVNTRPLNLGGTLTQMPMVGTTLVRQGGGSPIPLRDTVTGAEPLRLVTASLTTMFGLDYGGAYPGSLSGLVFEDLNGDNVRQVGEGGLAGATIVVTQAVTEEGPTTDHGSGGGQGGGQGGSGEGETTPPPVYLTLTDASGNWSITDLAPGVYTVTVLPPPSYGVSGGATFSYTMTIASRNQLGGVDFGNYPINDPPVIAAPVTQTATEDATVVFSTATGNAITISDPDAGTEPVQVTLTATGGLLTLASTSGLVFTVGDGSADGAMTFTGTLTSINAALDGLRFAPIPDAFGPAAILVAVDDLGNTGLEGAKTAQSTIAVDIAAVADQPTLAVADAEGVEGQPVPVAITATPTDTTGTEVLSITIAGLPAGSTLSAGTNLGGGTWRLTPAQLPGLAITPGDSGEYHLTVTATSTAPSSGSTASIVRSMLLRVANAEPAVVQVPNQEVRTGSPAMIQLGEFADVAGDGPWSVTVDWGDGQTTNATMMTPGPLGTMPHLYARSGAFLVTVSVADKDGAVTRQQFQVTVGPAAVADVVVGDGSLQRSRVTSMTVEFTGPVTVMPGAITLRDQRGRIVPVQVASVLIQGRTVTTLTFRGRRIVAGSLPDGRYTLTIDGGLILDSATGTSIDAAGTGVAGSHRVVTAHRLFGDTNGDGVVNSLDATLARSALRRRAGQPGYLDCLDYNGDRYIGWTDLSRLYLRWRRG